MPRNTRIEYAGAVYHVLDRGDRREAVFRDEEDRRRFLATLEEACGRTGWRVHAFVLMSNHYHLLLETPEANMVAGMESNLEGVELAGNAGNMAATNHLGIWRNLEIWSFSPFPATRRVPRNRETPMIARLRRIYAPCIRFSG